MTEPNLHIRARIIKVEAINKNFSDAYIVETHCLELPMTPTRLSIWTGSSFELATRVVAAINDDVMLTDVHVELDANDEEFIAFKQHIFGKFLEVDLKSHGY